MTPWVVILYIANAVLLGGWQGTPTALYIPVMSKAACESVIAQERAKGHLVWGDCINRVELK